MATLATTNVRAGDRDRESAARHLGHALRQGYLDMAEYEDRIVKAFGAHTKAELRPLLADLPVARRDQVQAALAEGRVRFGPFTRDDHEVWIAVAGESVRLRVSGHAPKSQCDTVKTPTRNSLRKQHPHLRGRQRRQFSSTWEVRRSRKRA